MSHVNISSIPKKTKREKPITFRKQTKLCREDGSLKYIKCYYCKVEIPLCKKYDDICQSELCREEREYHIPLPVGM